MQPQFITLPKNAIDITNQRFGRLTALGPIERSGGRIFWLCQCDCGKTTTAIAGHLRNGNRKSCGCLYAEHAKQRQIIPDTERERVYAIWNMMIQRCHNPNNLSYHRYGERGITVCDEWRYNFQSFYDYISQLSHYKEKGYTLDRIDNSLGYFPDNIRYSTYTDQARNRRSNRLLTHNGKTQSVAAWAEELAISYATLENRVKRGWLVEHILTIPSGQRRPR